MDGKRGIGAGPITLRLNINRYEKLAAERGWASHPQHVIGTGLSGATISRLLDNKQAAGPRVIAHLLRAFPDLTFGDLFETVPLDVFKRDLHRRAA